MRPPRLLILSALVLLLIAELHAAPADLSIWIIDVEGGQATLFVTPQGESVLIDSGFPGDRDAGRIASIAQQAGIHQIDYAITTHYHADHAGGLGALAARLPVRTFVDHGDTVETTEAAQKNYAVYRDVTAKSKRIVIRPGEKLPLKGLEWTIVSAAGNGIEKPLPGAGRPNQECANYQPKENSTSEDPASIGSAIAFGKFRTLDLGDLTWNKEGALVCPTNKLGQVDLLIVGHHGMNTSNPPALISAVGAKVALVGNGEKKGGAIEVLDRLRAAPGFVDLWQSHYAEAGGARNAAPEFIANPAGEPDAAHSIKVVAHRNGHFEVTNTRTGFTKKY